MTPEEFITIAHRMYADQWRGKIAGYLKVDRVTVRRWAKGAVPIPHPVALAVRALEEQK